MVSIRVSNHAIVLKLRAIARNCAQFLGVYRARNYAQVKFTSVGNPSFYTKVTCAMRISTAEKHLGIIRNLENLQYLPHY